ncbi:MAG TPA: hypothetical protein VJ999_12180 [Candidatus Sulfotelmatobacter sp.]|nr:hypothetical protein [Candidatus Sulfotelmatobacter sp.]
MAKFVTDPEVEFEEELQAFDNDVDAATQCFYTWQTVHAAARKNRKVYDLLNRNAAFWVVALGSIQANSLIALENRGKPWTDGTFPIFPKRGKPGTMVSPPPHKLPMNCCPRALSRAARGNNEAGFSP